MLGEPLRDCSNVRSIFAGRNHLGIAVVLETGQEVTQERELEAHELEVST